MIEQIPYVVVIAALLIDKFVEKWGAQKKEAVQLKAENRWRDYYIRMASLVKAEDLKEFTRNQVMTPPPDPNVIDDLPPTEEEAEVLDEDNRQFIDASMIQMRDDKGNELEHV